MNRFLKGLQIIILWPWRWLNWSLRLLIRTVTLLFKYSNLIVLGILVLFLIHHFKILPALYEVDFFGLGSIGNANLAPPQRAKTLWDWMDLLIVPILLAGFALWFNEQAHRRESRSATEARKRDLRRSNDRFREEALQKYFEAMANYTVTLQDKPDVMKRVAFMRTVAVLRKLDSKRIEEVLDLLKNSEWLGLNVRFADPNLADLISVNLSNADLRDTDLRNVNLSGAKLNDTNLDGVNLNSADLNGADLSRASLTNANLQGADLSGANLTSADLGGSNLRKADLNAADLQGADLGLTDLTGANFDEFTKFSNTTILPDGKKWKSGAIDMGRFTNPDHTDFWNPNPLNGNLSN